MSEVLAEVAAVNQQIGPLLVELLNAPDEQAQSTRLRELGQHLSSLSAQCLARAAELDGRMVNGVGRVIIDSDV